LESPPRLRVGTPEQLGDPPGDTLYEVNVEEAKEGLEWNGIEADMQYVIDATNLLMEMVRREPKEDTSEVREYPISFSDNRDRSYDIISRSLWESALVTHARCFGMGKRVRLDASVFDGQPEGVLRWHKYFKDTRDKHVAHSVNPFEFGRFGVRLTGRGTDSVQVTDEGAFCTSIVAARPRNHRGAELACDLGQTMCDDPAQRSRSESARPGQSYV
jgi:hypothetical protein